MNLTVRDIIYIGMLSAICALATTFLIPLPGGGMVHLGSAALFTISALFGGLYGGLAGAIGSGLFDLVMENSVYPVLHRNQGYFRPRCRLHDCRFSS